MVPDAKEMCGRDVWLGEYPISYCTRKLLAETTSGLHLKRYGKLPSSIETSLKVMKENLYIPLSAVQMAKVVKAEYLQKTMGSCMSCSEENTINSPFLNQNNQICV